MTDKKTSRVAKIILWLAAAAGFFLILNYTSLGSTVRNTAFLASSPLQSFLWNHGQAINSWLDKLKSIDSLKTENNSLKLENQRLRAELADLLILRDENRELRTALNLGMEKEFELTTANIIAKDSFQDIIIIDKGSRDGIDIGFPVISAQKALVGKVEEALSDFSKVALISNKDSAISAKISNEKETVGIAKGENNLRLVFDLIPQENKVQKGDLVLTTSLGKIFPKGLLIGQVKSIDYSDVKPFQNAQIHPGFSLEELNLVFIITNWK